MKNLHLGSVLKCILFIEFRPTFKVLLPFATLFFCRSSFFLFFNQIQFDEKNLKIYKTMTRSPKKFTKKYSKKSWKETDYWYRIKEVSKMYYSFWVQTWKIGSITYTHPMKLIFCMAIRKIKFKWINHLHTSNGANFLCGHSKNYFKINEQFELLVQDSKVGTESHCTFWVFLLFDTPRIFGLKKIMSTVFVFAFHRLFQLQSVVLHILNFTRRDKWLIWIFLTKT